MEYEVSVGVFALLGLAAFCSGYVDAVVGGGGLIQVPSLLMAFPQHGPASLFGTNKLASIVGTTSAAVQYARRVAVPWKLALPGALAAMVGAWFGARAVSYLDPAVIRPLVLGLLIAVAIYTFAKKDFGTQKGLAHYDARHVAWVVVIALVVGFYDGFFGPGTGSFFIFLLARFLHMDFLGASVTAKILNVATNLAAIAYFSLNVTVLWWVGLWMALCNLSGAVIGSRMAIHHGAQFVRKMFLGVVSVLIVKMSYDLLA